MLLRTVFAYRNREYQAIEPLSINLSSPDLGRSQPESLAKEAGHDEINVLIATQNTFDIYSIKII